jgi:hypothetical protein
VCVCVCVCLCLCVIEEKEGVCNLRNVKTHSQCGNLHVVFEYEHVMNKRRGGGSIVIFIHMIHSGALAHEDAHLSYAFSVKPGCSLVGDRRRPRLRSTKRNVFGAVSSTSVAKSHSLLHVDVVSGNSSGVPKHTIASMGC